MQDGEIKHIRGTCPAGQAGRQKKEGIPAEHRQVADSFFHPCAGLHLLCLMAPCSCSNSRTTGGPGRPPRTSGLDPPTAVHHTNIGSLHLLTLLTWNLGIARTFTIRPPTPLPLSQGNLYPITIGEYMGRCTLQMTAILGGSLSRPSNTSGSLCNQRRL